MTRDGNDRSFMCLLLIFITVSQCSMEVSERKQAVALERIATELEQR